MNPAERDGEEAIRRALGYLPSERAQEALDEFVAFVFTTEEDGTDEWTTRKEKRHE